MKTIKKKKEEEEEEEEKVNPLINLAVKLGNNFSMICGV
jgi:DNA-binding XRE family transcriptional regulator